MRKLSLILVTVLCTALVPAMPAGAASAPDKGKAWAPKVKSKPLYGTKSPDQDPEVQRHYVEGHDGTDLYVETWLPAPAGDSVPPTKVPTILIMTPYVSQGVEEYPDGSLPSFINYFTARGFAVAQHHVRGTGESGGCLEQTAENQIKDGADVVQYLGRDAPWSNGKVGMYGISYDAETQISTAAYGDAKKLKYLKAIIPAASVGSQYDWNFMDGVPWAGQPAAGNSSYLASVSLFPGQVPAPQHYPEKLSCQAEVMLSSADQNGDYTEYWQKREYRPNAPRVKAATLMVHGLRDFNVQDITLAGFFDRLSKSTPHKGMFGVWNHAFPGAHASVEPEWARADWYDVVTSWFDRYLKGLKTKVEKWPDVQVQSNTGQWWTTNEFPTLKGPMGQLALGPGGKLGIKKPKGETTYQEQAQVGAPGPGQNAVFETKPMKKALHLTGQPMLDLWLMSDQSDGHVAAKLEVIGKDGEPLHHLGSYDEFQATYGVRSLQHIEPMRRGWFDQEVSDPFTPNEPSNVIIRFLPTDLVVGKGQTLRLTVSGTVSYSKGDSLPSGSVANITILHGCSRPSVLRFRMPSAKAKLINVREPDEKDLKLKSKPKRMGKQFGTKKLARKKVCGVKPRPLPFQ